MDSCGELGLTHRIVNPVDSDDSGPLYSLTHALFLLACKVKHCLTFWLPAKILFSRVGWSEYFIWETNEALKFETSVFIKPCVRPRPHPLYPSSITPQLVCNKIMFSYECWCGILWTNTSIKYRFTNIYDVLPFPVKLSKMVWRRSFVPPLLISREPEAHLGWLQGKVDTRTWRHNQVLQADFRQCFTSLSSNKGVCGGRESEDSRYWPAGTWLESKGLPRWSWM